MTTTGKGPVKSGEPEIFPIISPLKPFLEMPKVISNNEGLEKEVVVRMQPADISYYYPGFHWGTVVVMKSGSSYLLKIDTADLDAALSAYHKTVMTSPAAFGNLKITPKSKLHALD